MKNIESLINESIKYEFEAYQLYSLLEEIFQNDADFWKKLADEELNHASILRKSKSFINDNNEVLNIISIDDINIVKESIELFTQYNEEIKKNPSRETAYKIALKVETSLVENNYQKFMDIQPESDLIKVFQMINGEEKDHIKRINEYFK